MVAGSRAPISYLHNIITMLNAPTVNPRNQYALWQQRRSTLEEAEGDERTELISLARRFRRRRDLVPQLLPQLRPAAQPPRSQT